MFLLRNALVMLELPFMLYLMCLQEGLQNAEVVVRSFVVAHQSGSAAAGLCLQREVARTGGIVKPYPDAAADRVNAETAAQVDTPCSHGIETFLGQNRAAI